jgi:hypothetical protein
MVKVIVLMKSAIVIVKHVISSEHNLQVRCGKVSAKLCNDRGTLLESDGVLTSL